MPVTARSEIKSLASQYQLNFVLRLNAKLQNLVDYLLFEKKYLTFLNQLNRKSY